MQIYNTKLNDVQNHDIKNFKNIVTAFVLILVQFIKVVLINRSNMVIV